MNDAKMTINEAKKNFKNSGFTSKKRTTTSRSGKKLSILLAYFEGKQVGGVIIIDKNGNVDADSVNRRVNWDGFTKS